MKKLTGTGQELDRSRREGEKGENSTEIRTCRKRDSGGKRMGK
jgi:hypothetical protein